MASLVLEGGLRPPVSKGVVGVLKEGPPPFTGVVWFSKSAYADTEIAKTKKEREIMIRRQKQKIHDYRTLRKKEGGVRGERN